MCFVLFDNINYSNNLSSEFINLFEDDADLLILKNNVSKNEYNNNLFICNFLRNYNFNDYYQKLKDIINVGANEFSTIENTNSIFTRYFLSGGLLPPYQMELVPDLTEKYKIPFFKLNLKKKFKKNLYSDKNVLHLYKWMYKKNYQTLAKINNNVLTIKYVGTYNSRQMYINNCYEECASLISVDNISKFITYVKSLKKNEIENLNKKIKLWEDISLAEFIENGITDIILKYIKNYYIPKISIKISRYYYDQKIFIEE